LIVVLAQPSAIWTIRLIQDVIRVIGDSKQPDRPVVSHYYQADFAMFKKVSVHQMLGHGVLEPHSDGVATPDNIRVQPCDISFT